MSKKTKILTISLLSMAVAGFCLFMILVLCGHDFKIDVFNNFVANNRMGFMDKFFKIFTYLGSFYTLALLVLIGGLLLYFIAKKKRLAIFSVSAFALVSISNLIFKHIVRRERPLNFMIINETGYSFPSGHAMMSFAFFAICIYVVCVLVQNKVLKISLICLFSALTIFIGFSRIYLGVHYLSDIVAGWLLSFVILTCCWMVYDSKLFKISKNNLKEG